MNNMLLALEITVLGMGLVFAALILLWGMMSLLTAITADKKDDPSKQNMTVSVSAESVPVMAGDFAAQAAAIAVAIALTEQHISIEMSSAHPLREPSTTIVSAWQLGMRTRQMYQKGPIRRSRKAG